MRNVTILNDNQMITKMHRTIVVDEKQKNNERDTVHSMDSTFKHLNILTRRAIH